MPPRRREVGDVCHLVVDVKLDVGARGPLAAKRLAARPHERVRLVLEALQVLAESALVSLEQRGELGDADGGVELEEGADGGQQLLLRYL